MEGDRSRTELSAAEPLHGVQVAFFSSRHKTWKLSRNGSPQTLSPIDSAGKSKDTNAFHFIE